MTNQDINNCNQQDQKNPKMISDSTITNNNLNIIPKAKPTKNEKIQSIIKTKFQELYKKKFNLQNKKEEELPFLPTYL